jgi:Zn-dependent peptidase ImmA (M78 family)
MNEYMVGVNPIMLKWARERSGFSLEDAAKSITTIINITKWECGEASPTYFQLVRLSNKYGRPIALFFFPEPPNEPTPEQNFRTLPDWEVQKLPPSAINLIREARSRQLSLAELSEGVNPSERKIFIDVTISSNASALEIAINVRNYLGITIEKQNEWAGNTDALKYFRELVQDAGIFVFKAPFSAEGVDGFCLYDEQFPVIYINNSKPKHRQIFTLFHELAHILLRNNGITQENQDYIESLEGNNKQIEVFCNNFTAEFLMPRDDFHHQMGIYRSLPTMMLSDNLSQRYKVSKEAVLLRMLNQGFISAQEFQSCRSQLYTGPVKTKGSGGDHYRNIMTYLGDKYIDLAFGQYYSGACSVDQLAEYLGVKARQISRLEQYVLSRGYE